MDELDPIAKERYVEKLRLVGLGEDDDPYKLWNCGKMVDKMCFWPPVEHGHIYNYFIIRPGVFTQQQLMQWKSMEAFNYFKSGHVLYYLWCYDWRVLGAALLWLL